MSLEADVYEFERRIANLERELTRLQRQEQRLREQHELVVSRQQAMHANDGSQKQYFELDRQNEALTEEIVHVIHAEVLVDEILQAHRQHLITLRRYQARLKRARVRSEREHHDDWSGAPVSNQSRNPAKSSQSVLINQLET